MKRNKDKTIERILKVALEHFSQKGYEGARIDEIAEESGFNKATIYYHIGDKETLYKTTLTKMFTEIAKNIRANIDKEETVHDKLLMFIRTLHRMKHRYPHFPPTVMREFASKGERLTDEILVCIYKIVSLFVEIIELGMAQGVFRKVNPFMLYTTVIGSSVIIHTGYPVFLDAQERGIFDGSSIPPFDPEITSEIIYDFLIKSLENNNV